jgi:pteridine reductase
MVVLVTGAARRVGARIVQLLHADGANIVLHYRSSQAEADELVARMERGRPDSACALRADLGDAAARAQLIRDAVARWGRLDAVVKNASTFYPTPIETATEADWDELMTSNLRAPFFLAQAAAPHLRATRGCIVNIVDIHADRPLKQYPIYCIAKAGLAMLTKSLACELGPEIRVNGVAPGAILWPETGLDDDTKRKIVERTFLKRQGDPDDIARAVRYLIREATYTTGQILTVDGGRSLNA